MIMKYPVRMIMVVGALVLFLPLGLTALVSGREAVALQKKINREIYLPMILCEEIPGDYEEEMLKVQAVLARSSLYFYTEEKTEEEWEKKLDNFRKNIKNTRYQKIYQRMERAVEATRGQVLIWQGKVCPGIFHRVSSGTTRDGMEALQEVSYAFLTSVDSRQDAGAKEYLKGHYFTQESLRRRLEEEYPDMQLTDTPIADQIVIEKRDSQEYILEIRVGDKTVPGEEFRRKLELSSCNFTIQTFDKKIRFLCKGAGHGLGLSQYGGNELAKQGKTYRQILGTYFPDTQCKKISALDHAG